MKKKILIIGENSFLSLNLTEDLKNKFELKNISFENFCKLNMKDLSFYDIMINTAINKNYIQKKYNSKIDFDLNIAKKIKSLKIKFIFFSTRKVYKIGDNITENSLLRPNCTYSVNKLKTEKKISAILGKNLLILRISNIVGIQKNFSKRKMHDTFIDKFFFNIKKGFVYDNKNNYKDFLSTKQFSKIIENLIQKNCCGVYNVSLGVKVYLNEIIKWLNFHNKKKIIVKSLPKKYNDQNFYMNNSKLLKKLNLNISLKNLKKDCKRISKLYFQK